MKTLWNKVVALVKREWFLLIAVTVISLIIALFKLL